MGGRGGSFGSKGNTVYDWLAKLPTGGGKLQEIDIAKYRGQSLEQIERRLRSLKHEEAFVFDKSGNIIAAYRGDENSVALPKELRNQKDIVVTHGHPKSAAEFGGTFSFADMRNMLQSNWAEHRATAGGQGEMNYILRKTPKADAEGFYNQINRDYVDLRQQMKEKYNAAYKREQDRGSDRQKVLHIARQEAVGVLNAYYKNMAEKYGYEYVARKKDYRYGR